jgi:hypothetical protein
MQTNKIPQNKVRQALARLKTIRKWKTRDPEFYELNSLWHEELLLLQFLQDTEKWNGEKSEIPVVSEAESQSLYCKIPKVTPDTYPCGALIQALEAT